MIIDESIVSGGITPQLLYKLITKHESDCERYQNLYNYYIGKHKIESRTRNSDSANNKIICNHAKYITDMTQSYLTGNPVTYAASEEFDIEPIKNAYIEQDIAGLDSELVKNMSIYGRAYELVYANEDSRPRSVRLKPENTFVCYSQTAAEKPLFGVYYYRRYDINGNVSGVVCNVYDDNQWYTYEANTDSFNNMELVITEPHYFGDVPILEYRNNEENQGDFEQLIPLIDAYNILQSDRVNDKEQFVDAFLFLIGIEIDSEEAKKLREERILMGYEGAAAQYLSKVMTESDIKVLRDDLKDDIHRFSMVPDLSDESFGNNLSGVAIKYKLMGFEQQVKNKERYFARTLRKRFKLYNNYLSILNSMSEVPTHRVDIVFTYNLPANELEISQMVSNLKDIASDETLLDCLPFVSDAKEEAALAKKEKEESRLSRLRSVQDMAEGGGY